eukprot:PITA_30933
MTKEEVSEFIKEMQNGEALGLDGFNVDFFKACWEIVKQDILDVVEDSTKSKIVLRALNASFIALFPKQEKAMTPDRFRPIALCNLVYKIISKVIANRLKPLLPTLVSKEKAGYVEGRQILNNVIQAHNVVYSLKSNKQAAKEEGKIKGLKLTLNGDALTHQQFVDDTMLQGTPTVKEAKSFKQILNEFAMDAGTEVSLTKSKIFFFNIDIAIQRKLTRILGFQREHLPAKYVVIPLIDIPLNKEIWELVTNKLQDKVQKWTSRSLNLLGWLVLTIVFLQTIPIFMFSALPSLKGVVQHIRNIQRDFIWGKGEEKKKWALVSWDKIYKPRTHGGLGLHDPETLSKVLGESLW